MTSQMSDLTPWPDGGYLPLRAWHVAALPGILRPMPVSRFALRRTTATLLPLSFLWLCVACAFICGQESGGPTLSLAPAPAMLAETKGGPACEGCPFASFPKVTLPNRMAFDAGSQTASADLPPSPPASSPATVAFVRPLGQAPPTSPPLQFLPPLRI